jgi:hypothetical protein
MLLLVILVAMAPVAIVLALALWRRYMLRDTAAGSLLPGVAMGLLAGVILGAGIGLMILGVAKVLARALGR